MSLGATSRVIVGCYTDSGFKTGLQLYNLNWASKKAELLSALEIANASYLSYVASENLIYAVNENHGPEDRITALKLDGSVGFTVLNDASIYGIDPCYVSVDSKLNHVFTANYSSGNFCATPLDKAHYLSPKSQVISHLPDDVNKKSHIHATVLSPDEKFLLVTNLGLDTITLYRYDPSNVEGPLTEFKENQFGLPLGTGPRHLIFSNTGEFVYVVGELDGTLHVFAWNAGKLHKIQQINLMPEDYRGFNSAADLHFSPNGKYIYVSNRGDANQLISFRVDEIHGTVSLLDRISTQGVGPRNFTIDPSGEFALIANQKSGDVQLFKLDKNSGEIYHHSELFKVESPVFVDFL